MKTKEEVLKRLKELSLKDPPDSTRVWNQIVDPESAHVEADDLLLELINDKEISEAFDKIDKWYS